MSREVSILNDCFHPEWDVLAEISTTMKALGITLNMKHVKGHADQKKKYNDLDLLSQLNVDANALATQALDEAAVQ